jgi:hypothetical protein
MLNLILDVKSSRQNSTRYRKRAIANKSMGCVNRRTQCCLFPATQFKYPRSAGGLVRNKFFLLLVQLFDFRLPPPGIEGHVPILFLDTNRKI